MENSLGVGQGGIFGNGSKSCCLAGGALRPTYCCSCRCALLVLSLAVLFGWVLEFDRAGLRPASSSSVVVVSRGGWHVAARVVRHD